MQAPRMRAKRPILRAMQNPCGCAKPNPVTAGAGVTQTQPAYQTAGAQQAQRQAIYNNWRFGYRVPSMSACPAQAPYACSGFPDQCSAFPPGDPLHGVDCKSYTTPQPSQGVRGPQVRYGDRQGNPVGTIDPFLDWKRTIDPFATGVPRRIAARTAPGPGFKYCCYPTPYPGDVNDDHCVQVPIDTDCGYTSKPKPAAPYRRPGIFRRVMSRIAGR